MNDINISKNQKIYFLFSPKDRTEGERAELRGKSPNYSFFGALLSVEMAQMAKAQV